MFRVSKKITGVLVVGGLLMLCAYLYWKPVPIVPDPKLGAVDIVKVRNAEGELVLLEDYDEARILNYLATCKERRILEDVGAYSLGDADVLSVQLSFYINRKDIKPDKDREFVS